MTHNNYDGEKAKVGTWLYMVIKSVVSNEQKKEGKSGDALDHVEDIETKVNIIGKVDAGDAGDEVERLLKQARLSSRDKDLIRGHWIEGLNYKELGVKYNIKEATVAQALHRALTALKSLNN